MMFLLENLPLSLGILSIVFAIAAIANEVQERRHGP